MSLYSIRFILRAALEIPSGIIADALGRINSLLFAYSFYIISFAAYFFSNSYAFLVVASTLFGIGDAFRTGTHKAMIIEYLRLNNWSEYKTSYYGHTRSWSQAGSAISALLSALIIILLNNFEIIFLFAIIPTLAGFALLITYPKNLDRKEKSVPVIKTILHAVKNSWRVLTKKESIGMLVNTSFYFGFHNSIKDLLQPLIQSIVLLIPVGLYLNGEQRTALLIAVFYFIVYVLSVFSSRSAGSISKHFKNSLSAINTLSLTGVLTCLFIALFIFYDLPIISAILFIPFFPIISMQRPYAVSKISENIDNKIMATALSVESQIGSLIAGILAFIAGVSITKYGLGVGLGIISLLALIIILIFKFFAHFNEKNRSENSK